MGFWIITICLVIACNVSDPGKTGEDGVRISVDRNAYANGDTIVVSIDNDLDSLLTTVDHQSFCWIAELQLAGADDWKAAGPCYSMAPAQEQSMAAHERQLLRVPVWIGAEAYPAVVTSGIYRWKFMYSTGNTFTFKRTQFAFSQEFTVQ